MNLPQLPLEDWRDTKETLHRMSQIVGKIRLSSMPHRNHWWHVTLYVTPRGLTTGSMPYGEGTYEIQFDFIDHNLVILTSGGERRSFSLENVSVAGFYSRLVDDLRDVGVQVDIRAVPFDLTPTTPFPSDNDHASYDRAHVERYFEILRFTDGVLRDFYGHFTGKQSPSHLFWHTFDLAMARYSGRRAPDRPEADGVTREAYSHEVIAFGFWAGDDNVAAPAFYSYIWPEPDRLDQHQLRPPAAQWIENRGSSLALLMYEDIRVVDDPYGALFSFFESCYEAGAEAAGWDIEGFRTVRFT